MIDRHTEVSEKDHFTTVLTFNCNINEVFDITIQSIHRADLRQTFKEEPLLKMCQKMCVSDAFEGHSEYLKSSKMTLVTVFFFLPGQTVLLEQRQYKNDSG